ncbi:nucleotidyl cyclase domain-containing protein [Saccharothrix syringae]|uniref:Guanylate cyclase domain-containing protein n=1 Tax=Saccharothrix syringae TaxID=103733 RepID=A0A5Q0H1N5_SACSY|nr:hypothetical protein [Saccharothrix syringae]QFZ20118.1 hypothetical protein EKG83_24280 [Saccharothrix syringae]
MSNFCGTRRFPRSPVHRIIAVVDVAGFGSRCRTNAHQVAVRRGLYRVVRRALERSGVGRSRYRLEDRGDGVLILVEPDVPKTAFVDFVPREMTRELAAHNDKHPVQERVRLRMALHAGEVLYDEYGVTGAAVNLTFRLLDATPVRDALRVASRRYALVTSDWFFEEVVRQSVNAHPRNFRPVVVRVKETETTGWLYTESVERASSEKQCVLCGCTHSD